MEEILFQMEKNSIAFCNNYLELNVNEKVLDKIRFAILNNKKIQAVYHNKERILEPLGVIYKDKIFLIAREKEKGKEIYTYNLNKFEKLNTTNENFNLDGFDFISYCKDVFGIYKSNVQEVKLKFSPEIKDKIKEYKFNFKHKIEFNENGEGFLTFITGGDIELYRFVFKYGKNCQIVSPEKLKIGYKNYLEEILNNIN